MDKPTYDELKDIVIRLNLSVWNLSNKLEKLEAERDNAIYELELYHSEPTKPTNKPSDTTDIEE